MSGLRSLTLAVPPGEDGRNNLPQSWGRRSASRTVRTGQDFAEYFMNASVEALQVAHRAPRAPAPAPEMVVREGVLDVPGEVALYHGGRLTGIRVAWRLVGPANAPVVCALGGISANRRVFVTEDPKQGWWSEVVGPGQALDAECFRVLSFDYLGGSADTTGPRCARDADVRGVVSTDLRRASAATPGSRSDNADDPRAAAPSVQALYDSSTAEANTPFREAKPGRPMV